MVNKFDSPGLHHLDSYPGRPSTVSVQGGLADNFAQQQDGDVGNSQSQSALGSDIEGSDDYEPPEPVSSTESLLMDEEITTKAAQSAHDSLASGGEQPNAATEATEERPDTMLTTSDSHPTPKVWSLPMPVSLLNRKKDEVPNFKHDQGHYIPYESPLKYFKSYRYHRSFPDDVADGFRSLPYSHNIKPEEPICPFEIGGICNDQSCPYRRCLSD